MLEAQLQRGCARQRISEVYRASPAREKNQVVLEDEGRNETIVSLEGKRWPHPARSFAGSTVNGSSRGRFQWVSVDNRISIVCGDEYYFLPAFDGSINDAVVESVTESLAYIAIGTDYGLQFVLANVGDNLDLAVIDHQEISTNGHSVRALFLCGTDTLLVCLENCQIFSLTIKVSEAHRLVLLSDFTENVKSSIGAAVASALHHVWGRFSMLGEGNRNFRWASWNAVQKYLVVLSSTDVSLWKMNLGDATESAADFSSLRTARIHCVGSIAVHGASCVLADVSGPLTEQNKTFLAPARKKAPLDEMIVGAVVYPDGSREYIAVGTAAYSSKTHKHVPLRVCSPRLYLPGALRVGNVTKCASAGEDFFALYDESTNSVISIATGVPEYFTHFTSGKLYTPSSHRLGTVEVVCVLTCTDHITGFSVTDASSGLNLSTFLGCSTDQLRAYNGFPTQLADGDGQSSACIALHTRSGIAKVVYRRTNVSLLQRFVSDGALSEDTLSGVVECVGSTFAADNLLRVLLSGVSAPPRVFSLLNTLFTPTINGRVVSMSQGASAVYMMVVRTIQHADDVLAKSRYNTAIYASILKRLVGTLEHTQQLLYALLESRGYLDVTCSFSSPKWEIPGLDKLICADTSKQRPISATLPPAEASSETPPNPALHNSVQAHFLRALLEGLHRAVVSIWLHAVSATYGYMLTYPPTTTTTTIIATDGEEEEEESSSVSRAVRNSLASVVWRNVDIVQVDGDRQEDTDYYHKMPFDEVLCTWFDELLRTDQVDLVRELEKKASQLPRRIAVRAELKSCILSGDATSCLQLVANNIELLVAEGLVNQITDDIDSAFPGQHLRLQLLMVLCQRERNADGPAHREVVRMLENLPVDPPQTLLEVLSVALQTSLVDTDLNQFLVAWMASHTLDDPRIKLYAALASRYALQLPTPRSFTESFFACWATKERGSAVNAARGFSELARTTQPLPLQGRLVCIGLALEIDPSEADRLAMYTLQLQSDLVAVLQQTRMHADESSSGRRELDRAIEEAQTQFLDERQLFQLAAQFQSHGGCKVQLDLLKTHPEVRESVTEDILHNVLEFETKANCAPIDTCRKVLHEYYDTYLAGLPVEPFIEFLAERGYGGVEIAGLLVECSIPVEAVFEAFMSLLEEHTDEPTLSTGDRLLALAHLCRGMSGDKQRVCAAYTVEQIDALLSGAARNAVVTSAAQHDALSTELAAMKLCVDESC